MKKEDIYCNLLIKGLRNQVASLDLICCQRVLNAALFSCSQSVGSFQPLIDAYNYTFEKIYILSLAQHSDEHIKHLYLGLSFTFFSSVMIIAHEPARFWWHACKVKQKPEILHCSHRRQPQTLLCESLRLLHFAVM